MKRMLLFLLLLLTGCGPAKTYVYTEPVPLPSEHFYATVDFTDAQANTTDTYTGIEVNAGQLGPALNFDGVLGLCYDTKCKLSQSFTNIYNMFGVGVTDTYTGDVTVSDTGDFVATVADEEHVYGLDNSVDITYHFLWRFYDWTTTATQKEPLSFHDMRDERTWEGAFRNRMNR